MENAKVTLETRTANLAIKEEGKAVTESSKRMEIPSMTGTGEEVEKEETPKTSEEKAGETNQEVETGISEEVTAETTEETINTSRRMERVRKTELRTYKVEKLQLDIDKSVFKNEID